MRSLGITRRNATLPLDAFGEEGSEEFSEIQWTLDSVQSPEITWPTKQQSSLLIPPLSQVEQSQVVHIVDAATIVIFTIIDGV